MDHSPSLRHLKHLANRAKHRVPSGRHSDSRVIPDLHPTGHVASGCYPAGLILYVRASRHGIVSAEERLLGDFGGQNTEAPPLPLSSRFSQFGTVSGWAHLQGLSPLSWLSYSPQVVWTCRRAWSGPGPACRQTEAPHASQVERAIGPQSDSPDPLDGICTRFVSGRP